MLLLVDKVISASKDGYLYGNIKARKVLLATNAWASGHRNISRRVAAIRDRIVVAEPLTRVQMRKIGWQHRQGIYDTRTQLNYMRLTADNRILFGHGACKRGSR